MSKRRILFFNRDIAHVLSGYRESGTHIRGYVDHKGHSLIVRKIGTLRWPVHETNALSDCSDRNRLGFINPAELVIVTIPEHVRGDFNVLIAWARSNHTFPDVNAGSLDDSVPNHTDASKRGFDPK